MTTTDVEYIRANLVPQWQPIETAPEPGSKKMFVVIAFNVKTSFNQHFYTSDPVCVWRCPSGAFMRWKHEFLPTHWMPLPEPPK